jgi:proteasome lid subunit RPN8/RPN11
MKAITLPRAMVNQLLTQAQNNRHHETCGLVSAKQGKPYRVYPVKNIADNTQHLFEMDPVEQINAMKQMRDNQEDLFAIYHSHPDAPAEPSAEDIRQANYPDAVYLIISLNIKGVLEMQAFYLKPEGIQPIELNI